MPIQIQFLLGAVILIVALQVKPERLLRHRWLFATIVAGFFMVADLLYNWLVP